MTKILEFLVSVVLLPRNDAVNSRIPYRDPRVKLGDDIVEDDIVGNSRISKKRHPLTPRKSRIPKDKFRIPKQKTAL